ncbi:MAG: sn-glycerol-3-phosphate ABC transporter ATP-binding protein UgpC [Burkholderiaceae bacterium]
MHALRIQNVAKQFGDTQVLKDINIEVAAGEFLILVGPSGCGKSTLLHCIAGLESVSSGEIWMGERNVNKVSPKDRDIAMVFQSYALYPNMDVRGNIAFGMQMRGVPKAEQQRKIAEVAAILQMEQLLDRKPGQLSGGQRQRVAMGRALARNPSLFLFDEPLSNLDAKLRVEMRAEIKLLHQRTKTTSVYVTHDQIEAMTLGDRIAVMKDGVVQQFGTPDEIYRQPVNLFVAGFMGSPAMNFIPVTVERAPGGDAGLVAQVQVEGGRGGAAAGQAPLLLSLPSGLAARVSVGKALTLGVRPEAVRFGDAQGVPVTVQLVEPTGPDTLVMFELGGGKCLGRHAPASAPKPGETVRVSLDPAALVYFDPESGERV